MSFEKKVEIRFLQPYKLSLDGGQTVYRAHKDEILKVSESRANSLIFTKVAELAWEGPQEGRPIPNSTAVLIDREVKPATPPSMKGNHD